MIELRGLVAAPGLAPLSGLVRMGEVMRLDGPPAAARAVLEVLAGRRRPVAGEVHWRDGRAPGVLVRAGETLPAGIGPDDAIALWRALAGGERGGAAVTRTAAATGARAAARGDGQANGQGEAGAAASRALGVGPVAWLIDGPVEPGAEPVVARADQDVRGGSGALVWTAVAARGHADRVLLVEEERRGGRGDAGAGARTAAGASGRMSAMAATATTTGVVTGGERRRALTRTERARAALALGRFAVAVTGSRGSLGVAVVSALWVALVAAMVGAHEGFWFVPGSRVALDQVVTVVATGVAAVAAAAAATRAAATGAWSAMLRETGATPAVRTAALVSGDLAGALPSAVVAAWPAWWSAAAVGDAGALRMPLTNMLAVLVAAALAAVVVRIVRVAPIGALVGAAVAAMLVW